MTQHTVRACILQEHHYTLQHLSLHAGKLHLTPHCLKSLVLYLDSLFAVSSQMTDSSFVKPIIRSSALRVHRMHTHCIEVKLFHLLCWKADQQLLGFCLTPG